jgi:hypothetical protein
MMCCYFSIWNLRFKIVKIIVLWAMTPSSVIGGNQHLGGTGLHFQSGKLNQ